jgi:hypothetical protein
MASDDWRIRIDVADKVDTLLERLGLDLSDEARELALGLEEQRLAVSRDGDTVFAYAPSAAQAEQARRVVEAELREAGLEAHSIRVEHWLSDEERWDNEPAQPDWEDEVAGRGYAPWEVRVERESHAEAERLADELEAEGYGVARRWRFVIVGAESREEAEELAQRLHGDVEPGGELVYEVPEGNRNPFAVFAFRNPF